MAPTTIGYVPYSRDLRGPGDRRRLAFYSRARPARVHLALNPDPAAPPPVVFLATTADVTTWVDLPRTTRVVYEVIDAYFTVPSWAPANLGRGALKWLTRSTKHLALDYRGAMERMCRRADAVICSTEEQRETIERWCPNVHIILDWHGDDVGHVKRAHEVQHPPRVMWEGGPGTLAALSEVTEAFRRLRRDQPIRVDLVTDTEYYQYVRRFWLRSSTDVAHRLIGDHELHPWSPEALQAVGAVADLAIVPVDRSTPLAMGKPENRLLLLWRMGQCVVATRTPAAERAMRMAGTEAALCDGPDDWVRTIRRLLADPDERAELAKRGQEHALRVGDRDRLLNAWDAVLDSLDVPA